MTSTPSLDPRHRLPLVDKADIDALRQKKFQSEQLPVLDEFLGAELKRVQCDSSETDKILRRIECDEAGSGTESEGELEDSFHEKSRIQPDDGEDQPVFIETPMDLEKARAIAFETVFEAREANSGAGDVKELLEFVMKTFDGVHQSGKEQLKDLKSSKKTQFILCCKVLRGSGLSAKDSNGKSDPFCRLGLLKEAHLNSDIVKQKDLSDWNKDGMIGRGQFQVTSVKPETLEPKWNEMIEMPIGDINKEHLVLEVWDCDDNENDTSIKGVKGFVTYIAEKTTKKGDDFMGRMFYPLQSIPMPSGEEKTFSLHSHSGKSHHGTVTLQLYIRPIKESLPVQIAVSYYNILAHSLVNSCTKRDGRYLRSWDGQLTPEAERLLDYYALFNNICEVQKAYTKLMILLSYHELYRVELSVFYDQIEKIRTAEALPHQQSPYFSPKPELIVHLFDEFENQTSACIKAIMRDSDTKCCRKFKQRIKIFHQLYSFRPFTERLPPGSRSCDELLERCTSIIVANWFLEQYTELFTQTGREASLNGFRILTERCVDQFKKGFCIFHPFFTEVGVNFFSHFYIAFDKLIGAEGETRVCKTKDCSLYPVYQCFRKINELSQKAHIEKGSYLMKSLCWFERCGTVPHWIQLAIEKSKCCIRKAIEDDSPIPVTDCVNYSSSAHHTEGFLRQTGNFWKNLDWPEPLMSSCYAVMVVNGIAECCVFYVSETAKRLDCTEELFDEKGNFKVCQKLCIFFNNVDHIRNTLSECSKWLVLDPFYDSLEKKQKIGKKCKSLIEKIIQEADVEMQNCTNSIMLDIIAEKLVPRIQHFLHEMTQDRKQAEKMLTDTELCTPLLDYLTENLRTFTCSLHPSVANVILFYLWEASLDSVEKCFSEIPRKKGKDSAYLYYKLFMALSLLRQFFHCDGRGIAKKQLDTKKFEELHSRLYILGKSTEDLAFLYLSDLAQLQPKDNEMTEERGEKMFGTLHFSMAYFKEKSSVEVNVLRGMDLPALDNNGLSDPYVQVSLMPPWMFPNASHKTKVHKNTVNPLIDEEMSLPASEENLNVENTMLLLAVFDQDVIEDDFAGVCVVPCKDIPRLGVDDEQRAILEVDVPQRKVFRLPLFRPPNASPIRAELESRAGLSDSKAKQITKSVPSPK